MFRRSLLAGLLALGACAGCQSTPDPESSAPPSLQTSPSTAPPRPVESGPARDSVFGVPEGFKPVYKVNKDEDISYAAARRYTLRITVPPHLSRHTLEDNLRHAARYEYERRHPNALTVFAYRKGTDTDSTFTAGRIDFAPFGEWGRASEQVPLSDYKMVIDFAYDYFPVTKKK